ncbi:hypothetical protein [Pelagicoccus albus]|uniref:Uncharacterized protein n=1 Tax=Pelagicoccus albus TaxID=415222 RepID=A0A7X1B8F3_9BACT|nr:hypothetical protein [Pelagicoccus albus]MBC2607472.1 hypothetical protein [Pelagicoccus albus]
MREEFENWVRKALSQESASTPAVRKRVYGNLRVRLQESFSQRSPLPTQEEIERSYSSLEAAIEKIELEILSNRSGSQTGATYPKEAPPAHASATAKARPTKKKAAKTKGKKLLSETKAKKAGGGKFKSWLFGLVCGFAVFYGWQRWEKAKLDEAVRKIDIEEGDALWKTIRRVRGQ